MLDEDIATLISFFLGSFALGYTGGHLLMLFKKALGYFR